MQNEFNLKEITFAFNNVIQILKLISRYNKKLLYINVVLTLLTGFLPFVSLWNTQVIMNTIQANKEGSINTIIITMIIFIVIEIVSEIVSSLNAYYSAAYNDYLSYKLNVEVLNKTNDLGLKEFENPQTYDLIQRAEQEAGLRPFRIFTSLLTTFSSIIRLVTSVIILVLWHWWILLIVLILPTLFSSYFFRLSREEFLVYMNRTKYERKSWYLSHLLTKDTYIKEVKALSLTKYFVNYFKEIRYKFFIENLSLSKKRGIFTFVFQIMNLILTNGIVLLGIFESFIGKILIGNLMTYIKTTSMVEENIKTMVRLFFTIYQDSLYASQLIIFLNYTNENISPDTTIERVLIQNIDKIELKNVTYKYGENENYSLKNINLIINKGEKIALVGENGSGKTTLIKLLTNLYTDYTGEILINNINIKSIDPDKLKEKVSVIFQDFNEYQFRIKENIGFGDLKHLNDETRIQEVSQGLGLEDFISQLPKGYNQQVGQWFEGGLQLSGGQWQKLAIARAFIKDAQLYILDEPTAALDPLSEFKLFQKFSDLTDGKIGIFITHRFMNARFTDRIIVFENGEIIEQGTHQELIALNGKYSMLFHLQIGEKGLA